MSNLTNEQNLAVNKEDVNIIVSAGAGSGKTFVLSKRVVRKLLDGCNINEILILTFTNKAAKEMKERIRNEISDKPELINQLDLIDSSYISTFDAFSLAIVEKYNYILNINKDIKVGDNTLILIEKNRIIDEIFEEFYHMEDKNFFDMIEFFSLKNDKELKKQIIKINDSLDLKYNKEDYLKDYLNNYYNDDVINTNINKYLEIIFSNVKELENKMNELSTYIDGKNYPLYYPIYESKTYKEVKESVNRDLGRFGKSSDEEKDAIDEAKDIVKYLIELTKYDSLEEIRKIYQQTKGFAKIIVKILQELDKRLDKYKKDNNIYEFTDIAKMAIKLVKENKLVRDELKASFKEIMIDEYQDTSDLQEEFISSIANNNVYMVGDIKQSIYRFRNANPYLFKEKYDRSFSFNDIFKIDLTNNFRSRTEAVDNINLIFSHLMTDLIGGADYQKDHIMISGNKDYKEVKGQDNNLEILTYEYDKTSRFNKSEIEIFTIAKDIKNKVDNKYQIYVKENKEFIKRDITYSDFAILIDRSTNFDLIKKIFLYFNIPVVKNSSNNVALSIELQLIKNIITLILKRKERIIDLDFKYAFMSIGRSYLFEYDDNTLFKMILDKDYKSTLLDTVDSIFNELDCLSLNEIIYLIIEKFKFYEKIILVGNVKERISYLSYIVEFVNNASSYSYNLTNLLDFISKLVDDEYKLESKYKEEGIDGVNLMTIHASKGLEFSICYYIGLDSSFNVEELNKRFLFSNHYGIITPYYKDGIGSTIVKELYKREYILEEISEKIRLFYVALTRAKEKAIMVTRHNDKVVNSLSDIKSFEDMLLYSRNAINPFVKEIDINTLELTKAYDVINSKNYKEMLNDTRNKIIKEKVLIEKTKITKKKISKEVDNIITKDTKENIKLGIKMHEILEYIDFKNPKLEELDIDNSLKKKIEKFILSLNVDNVLNIYKEYEFKYIINNEEKHGIIDLIIEYKDYIWIIDYKLKKINDENYYIQLESYKDYISSLTNKKIELYLYSIIDENLSKINI